MKVKELLDILKCMDKEASVMIYDLEATEWLDLKQVLISDKNDFYLPLKDNEIGFVSGL